jgi:hypothetical protein
VKKLAFLTVLMAFAFPVAISAEEVDNSDLLADNDIIATWNRYVAQDESAPKDECPPPKPKEECNKCAPKEPVYECDKCPKRKPRCQKCPPKKPRCPPKEEPKKCAPPKPKCDN